jgi:hypothetical protein
LGIGVWAFSLYSLALFLSGLRPLRSMEFIKVRLLFVVYGPHTLLDFKYFSPLISWMGFDSPNIQIEKTSLLQVFSKLSMQFHVKKGCQVCYECDSSLGANIFIFYK